MLAGVVRNRLESLVNGGDEYPFNAKVQQIINKVLSMVKFPIALGKDKENGLYLDGLFYSNILAANELLSVPLKVQVRSDNSTFSSKNCQN